MADMPDREDDVATLASKVVQDSEKLIGEQVALLQAELSQELRRAGNAAIAIIAGIGIGTAGVVFLGLLLAHLVHEFTFLPLWCGYAIVGIAYAIGGVLLVRCGRSALTEVRQMLPQTVEAVKVNLAWLKKQIKAPGS